MKPSPRNVFCSLALLISTLTGCDGRQVVITAPRGATIPAKPKPGRPIQAPTTGGQAPGPRSLEPSNGVDVPVLQPE
jgi:hypothetical protein